MSGAKGEQRGGVGRADRGCGISSQAWPSWGLGLVPLRIVLAFTLPNTCGLAFLAAQAFLPSRLILDVCGAVSLG